jgi:hypothetical protein
MIGERGTAHAVPDTCAPTTLTIHIISRAQTLSTDFKLRTTREAFQEPTASASQHSHKMGVVILGIASSA